MSQKLVLRAQNEDVGRTILPHLAFLRAVYFFFFFCVSVPELLPESSCRQHNNSQSSRFMSAHLHGLISHFCFPRTPMITWGSSLKAPSSQDSLFPPTKPLSCSWEHLCAVGIKALQYLAHGNPVQIVLPCYCRYNSPVCSAAGQHDLPSQSPVALHLLKSLPSGA